VLNICRPFVVALLSGAVCAALWGVADSCAAPPRHLVAPGPDIVAAMKEKGMRKEAPVLIRSYKQEGELEIWKQVRGGRYELLKVFPICRWSGQLGPKLVEGDGQAPEGFYAITAAQMNPNSNYHLAFNTGYPNAYDRAHGRTGSALMVHGDCRSIGCYAMSDPQIEDIYALLRDAHAAGQQAVQMQALPFRFTPRNLARHRLDPNMPFWSNLKEGADRFEISRKEPRVVLCEGRYGFDRVASSLASCGREGNPALARKLAEKQKADAAALAAVVAGGEPAVSFVYLYGGQNGYFRDKVGFELLIDAGPVIRPVDARGAPTTFGVHAAGGDEEAIERAIARATEPPQTPSGMAGDGSASADAGPPAGTSELPLAAPAVVVAQDQDRSAARSATSTGENGSRSRSDAAGETAPEARRAAPTIVVVIVLLLVIAAGSALRPRRRRDAVRG